MKSKELIRLLQEEDPTGEVEVCVNNVDIYFLSTEPAYWDGSLQVLSRDESKSPYYNLTGGKYVRGGSKIVIHPVSISEVVRENPDTAVVDYSELGPQWIQQSVDYHEKIRQSARDLDKKVDQGFFVRWVQKKAEALYPEHDVEEVKEAAEDFYERNLSPNDPLKVLPSKKNAQGYECWPSVVDRRESHWEDIAEVLFNGWWSVRKRV